MLIPCLPSGKDGDALFWAFKPRHEPLQRALCDPLDAGGETDTELPLNLAPRYPAGEQQSPRAGSGGDVSHCHAWLPLEDFNLSSDIKTGIFILKNHPGCCVENCPGEEGAGRSLGGGSRRLVPGSRWQRWSSGRRDEWDPKERGGPGRLLHTTGFASVTERGVGPSSTLKSQ